MRMLRSRGLSLALVALVVAAGGCTTRQRQPAPAAPSASQRPATTGAPARPAVAHGTTYAAGNYVIEGGWTASQRVAAGRPTVLPVTKLVARGGPMKSVALVFPLLRRPVRCVRHVELWLRLLGGQGRDATLAAYPSALLSLAAGRRPASVPQALLDNRPRGVAEVALTARWAVIEISELYRTWATGGPFPSEQAAIPAGTPLIVVIRPPAYDDTPDFVRSFAAMGPGRASDPQLRWTAASDC